MKNDNEVTADLIERFQNSKEFTQELVTEYENLRRAVVQLRVEKRQLEQELCGTEVGSLKVRIKQLEFDLAAQHDKNQEMAANYAIADRERREFEERYLDVENQNSDLVNLFIAAQQLHSTIDYAEVITILKDVVINMVGSEDFAIYMRDTRDDRARLIAHHGIEHRCMDSIASGDIRSTQTLSTGKMWVAKLAPGQREHLNGQPIACIPLVADGVVFGVITIYSILTQKDGFKPLDYELFELLSNQAATALMGARLNALHKEQEDDLDNFVTMLGALPKPAPLDDPRISSLEDLILW